MARTILAILIVILLVLLSIFIPKAARNQQIPATTHTRHIRWDPVTYADDGTQGKLKTHDGP